MPSAPSKLLPVVAGTCLLAVALFHANGAAERAVAQRSPTDHPAPAFLTSHDCVACHNGLRTAAGEDVSIAASWRASMMANSSRDPYWHASVRREVIDHRAARPAIEDECSICHMPMSRTKARFSGRHGEIFSHLPIGVRDSAESRLAADGVSCAMCHQIGPQGLGTRESFTGGFVMSPPTPAGEPRISGPFAIDAGRTALMRSATGMIPTEAPHVRESALCATCHTLYTSALDSDGTVVGELPEQVPYLEWQHSALSEERRSCQSCHMPSIAEPARMSSVLGDERIGLGRHTFFGGNFFMLRMLNRYRGALGVEALPHELEAAAHATVRQLQQDTATVSLTRAHADGDQLSVDVHVANLTGHKLPTGYPSRRAWLYVTVRDGENQLIFSSGAVTPAGSIEGNDNDDDAVRFEPHHTEIRSGDQVQIYESVMRDHRGVVTTGLLRAVAYAKDNRLLPRGFNKRTAPSDVAVVGEASEDDDFESGGDRVRYVVGTRGHTGPFRIDVELHFQPIAFRWAQNLKAYDSEETRRFVSFYEAMSASSSVVLVRSTTSIPRAAEGR